LPNRVLFHDRLEQEIRDIAHGNQFAVLLIDIDSFKGVNDSLGHAVGDELLKAVAAQLRASVGGSSFIARLGGDEFAIVQTVV
ncbi:GGDEF domain-containing protein, partial [Acinetobacter baumannii]